MIDGPLDLTPLEPPAEVKERTVGAALERVADEPRIPRPSPPIWRGILAGAGRHAVPALAAAATVMLLLTAENGSVRSSAPSRTAPPDLLVAPPEPWGGWIADSRAPRPGQLLVTFAGVP